MNGKSGSIQNLVVNFLPGLVLGIVCGGLLGAFFVPIAEAWTSNTPPRTKSVLLASQDAKAR